MKIYQLIFILPALFLSTPAAQWVDPHSMDTKFKEKLPSRPQTAPESGISPPKTENDSDVHLRRIVRIILNNAHLANEVGYHEGYINIKLSANEHELLINFSQGKVAPDGIFGEISHIFENAFQKTSSEKYDEMVLSFEEKLYRAIYNPASQVLVSLFFALLLTYKLLKAQFTVKSIIKFFLFSAYLGDVVVTYLNILREEEVASMVNLKTLGTTPPECDPTKMSWWDFAKTQFKSTFTENPCKAYYQATYQDYQYIVAPSKVLTRQFRTLIVEPFGDVGEAFGKFGRGMFTNLPWGLNLVIFPLMLVTAIAMFFMIFLFITKPHFKISLFHLFTIELGKSEQDYREEKVFAVSNGENRKKIGYVPNRLKNKKRGNLGREVGFQNHREIVQEVNDNSSSPGDKDVDKKIKNKCLDGPKSPKSKEN